MQLKCAFHTHSGSDPRDKIKYTEQQLIDHAAKLNFDVLAITCHEKIVFNKALQDYAKKKNILLIPALEASIQGKDILIINAPASAEKIKSLNELRTWKKENKESFVIAPHPYMPSTHSLGSYFESNLDLFDAVEYSFFYTKFINFNQKAEHIANKNNLPIIATSDSHFLEYLDIGYCEVETNEKTIPSIIKSLRQNNIKNYTKPLSLLKMAHIYAKMLRI